MGFVVGIAGEEAPAGELGDLFGDQALFVEAVAQALLRGGRVEGEGVQQVVGAEPLAVVGKARVGFDEVAAAGVGGKGEEPACMERSAPADARPGGQGAEPGERGAAAASPAPHTTPRALRALAATTCGFGSGDQAAAMGVEDQAVGVGVHGLFRPVIDP